MSKLNWTRFAFAVLGGLCLFALFIAYNVLYMFGPLSFSAGRPNFFVTIVTYKEYYVIGLLHLALLVAGILSFHVVFRPLKDAMQNAIFSYLIALIIFCANPFWLAFLRGNSL